MNTVFPLFLFYVTLTLTLNFFFRVINDPPSCLQLSHYSLRIPSDAAISGCSKSRSDLFNLSIERLSVESHSVVRQQRQHLPLTRRSDCTAGTIHQQGRCHTRARQSQQRGRGHFT